MTDTCLELAVFKVRDAEKARIARRVAQQTVRHYEGFIAWTAYEAIEDRGLFADIVLWKNLQSAKAAADRLMKDPALADVLAEIDGILTLSHFAPDQAVEAACVAA